MAFSQECHHLAVVGTGVGLVIGGLTGMLAGFFAGAAVGNSLASMWIITLLVNIAATVATLSFKSKTRR